MKAMVVRRTGGPFEFEERPVPRPGAGQVLVRVYACGVCHSDQVVTEGLWPGLDFPRVAGHEVAGVVEAVGDGVDHIAVGKRVGIGWHGGHDGTCDACLAGRFQGCENAKITGVTTDGGYAEFLVIPAVACAPLPNGMPFEQAAPLMCAGVTSFNALRHSGARAGDLVGIQGLGGVGHLAVQYARAMGFEVAAISRGSGNATFAHQLGAHHYVDTDKEPAGSALASLGGAKAILATAPDAASISALPDGLGRGGSLVVVGVPGEPVQFSAQGLISGNRSIQGWSSGTATDSTEALSFAQMQGIEPMIEVFPLADLSTAFEKMVHGKVRFRAVVRVTES